jgi:hypothetical protein
MPTDRAPDYDDKTDEGLRPGVTANAPAPVLEPNEARGAATHHNVRFVLAISVTVLVVAYVILYFAFFRGGMPPGP